MKEKTALRIVLSELKKGNKIMSMSTIESYFGQGTLKDRYFMNDLKEGIKSLKQAGYLTEIRSEIYRFNGDYKSALELFKILNISQEIQAYEQEQKVVAWDELKNVDKFRYQFSLADDDDEEDDDDDFFKPSSRSNRALNNLMGVGHNTVEKKNEDEENEDEEDLEEDICELEKDISDLLLEEDDSLTSPFENDCMFIIESIVHKYSTRERAASYTKCCIENAVGYQKEVLTRVLKEFTIASDQQFSALRSICADEPLAKSIFDEIAKHDFILLNNEKNSDYLKALYWVISEGVATNLRVICRIGCGYSEAADLLEQMEKEQVVSPLRNGTRSILVTKEEYCQRYCI